MQRYARFAWGVLGVNLLVILWGAFVRASGSGAGCGSHWPLCNGEVVPRAAAVATLIEFGHRVTSGIALVLVVLLVVGAWRRFPRGHAVRRAAAFSGLFIVTEALIGAGLVLFEMVAENASVARGFWVSGHLANTYLLVGALTVTAWWSSSAPVPRFDRWGSDTLCLGLALLGLIVLGVSGAVTALGDTLFPVSSLAEAKAQTLSESAHLFVRLRIWHPTLAAVVGIWVLFAAFYAVSRRPGRTARRLLAGVVAFYVLQILVGALNVWFLAPVVLQITHLLLSDVIWILLVLLTASFLVVPVPAVSPGRC